MGQKPGGVSLLGTGDLSSSAPGETGGMPCSLHHAGLAGVWPSLRLPKSMERFKIS